MTFDWGSICAGVACAVSAGALFIGRQHSRAAAIELRQLRGEVSAHARDYQAEIDTLRRQFQSMQTCMQDTDRILGEGRLNRSSRSHAFELLRTGVNPDTAALKMGMARREMKLLARVSQMLSSYK